MSSDTITLRLRLSDADVKAIEAQLKRAASGPIEIPVRGDALKKTSEQAKFAEGSLGALKSQIRQLGAEMDHLGDVKSIAEKQAEIKKLEEAVRKLTQATKDSADAAGSGGEGDSGGGGLLSKLPKVSGLTIAGAGAAALGAALADGAKKAIELDTAIRNIGSLGIENFEQYGAIAKEMSTRIPQSAVELAKGTYDAISAGIDPTKAAGFVEVAAKAGVAGLSSTETAVNALSSIINAYRLNADQATAVSDQMFMAANLGKTTFEEMNRAIANVVPVAASAGVSFAQVSGAIATMTKQGVPTVMASTQMRQAIVEILKPGEQLAAVMTKAGIANGATALKTLGLQGTLSKLEKAATESGLTMTQVFSSIEAGSAALSLTGKNAEMARADLDAVTNSAGAMGKAFDVNSKSAANQLKLLQNNLDAAKIGIVETFGPAMNWVFENFTGGLKKINEAFMSSEALNARSRSRGDAAFKDEQQRTRTVDRADAVKMLGLENEAALDNITITRERVRALQAAKGATDAQVDATVAYFKSLQKVAAAEGGGTNPPATTKKKKGTNEALQLALEQLRGEEEIELARARIYKYSEEQIIGIRLRYLNQQLAVQRTHGDKAINLTKTQNEIQKTELELSGIAMNRAVAGSIDAVQGKLRELQEKLTKIDPDSTMFATLSLQAAQLEEQLSGLKKRAEDPLLAMNPLMEGFIAPDEGEFQKRLKEALEIDEKQSKDMTKAYEEFGSSLGDALSGSLNESLKNSKSGAEAMRNLFRQILGETFAFIMKQAVLAEVSVALQELSTKGLAGLITAGLATAVIQGFMSTAKTAITGYATGGVIVGENGPEVIAPARDFSSFAERIVEAASNTFSAMLLKIDTMDRVSRSGDVSVGVYAEPIEMRLRGSDMVAAVRLQERRQRNAVLGGV